MACALQHRSTAQLARIPPTGTTEHPSTCHVGNQHATVMIGSHFTSGIVMRGRSLSEATLDLRLLGEELLELTGQLEGMLDSWARGPNRDTWTLLCRRATRPAPTCFVHTPMFLDVPNHPREPGSLRVARLRSGLEIFAELSQACCQARYLRCRIERPQVSLVTPVRQAARYGRPP